VTTSQNILQHRIATDPAVSVEVHEGTFTDDQPGYHLVFRYEYLGGYRSISVKDREVLEGLADQIKAILSAPQ
jgi:hypothetical protein